MAKVEAWFAQDLKKPVPVRYLNGSFFNEDAAGSRIGVEVYSDGEAVALAGSITGYCVRSDGTTVPISGVRSSNRAYIDIPQSALAVPGPLTVTIKNTESSVITTLCAVVGIITQSRTGVQVDPGQTITDWTNQISAQLQECQDAADNVGAIVAVPYASLPFPVEVGTYTTNGGNLYCCTTYIETSESFTASHWRQTKVCDEIRDLKSATELHLFQLRQSSVIKKEYMQWESGGLNSSTGADAPDGSDRQIRSSFLLAVPGEEIKFTGTSTNRLSIVCSYDKDKNFIAGSRKNIVTGSSYTIPAIPTAPANAYYVRFIYGFTTGAGQTVTGYGGVDAVAADWDISCISPTDSDINNRVSYAAAQTLTDAQKTTARSNIGAATAGDVTDLNSRVTALEDNKAEKESVINVIPNISSESFDYQQYTVHHDNFHRTITGDKPWHIGTNGTESFTMDYSSLDDDYETVDDGFRIIDNVLTTDTSVEVSESFRVIDNSPDCNFLVEIGLSRESLSGTGIVHCSFAYNIVDKNNYDSFDIYYNQGTGYGAAIRFGKSNGVNKTNNGDYVFTHKYTADSFRILFAGEKAFIWFDDCYITSVDAKIQAGTKIGLYKRLYSHNCRWDFINVHEMTPVTVEDSGKINDTQDPTTFVITEGGVTKELKGNCAIIQRFNGTNFEYLYNANSEKTYFSQRSERFQLNYLNDDPNGRRRSEVEFYNINKSKLRKVRIEFDLLLPGSPESFDADSTVDCILQMLCSSNDPLISYAPNFAIRVLNDNIQVHVWGQSFTDSTDHVEDVVYNIAAVDRGHWHHFDIYIKEGYMAGHCPLCVVKIDNTVVYKSTKINTTNTVTGSTIKYGIYKSQWYEGQKGDVETRVLYFDNMKLTM